MDLYGKPEKNVNTIKAHPAKPNDAHFQMSHTKRPDVMVEPDLEV